MHSLLTRLRRITSGATWIPEIDGLRFVAILGVVLFHIGGQVISKSGVIWTQHAWYQPILRLLSNGSRGVQLFFVISGFILGRPFARHALLGEKRVKLGSYYLRRITRLEPPYIFNLVLLTIVISLYVHPSPLTLIEHLLASVFYVHGLVYHEVSWINGVTWSLEIEIQFYLLVPLLVWLYRIRGNMLRRCIFALAIIFCSLFPEWASWQHLSPSLVTLVFETVVSSLQYFLAGLLLSDLYLTEVPRWRPNITWDLASLLCWPILFYLSSPWEARFASCMQAAALPFLIMIVFLGAFRGIYFPRFFRVEGIALIGGMCYSIYLWHFFVISIVFRLTKHIVVGHDYFLNQLLQDLLLIPVVLIFCGACYLFIERPCMDPKWPQKLMARKKATTAHTSS